ncbi:MFS transporter [Hydrogenimonas urashimensis]|uniref:MFS transporter n=1 Tax=Hydrogenimonas urashimensis TaxID=2740515 RepID=UPI001914E3AC|nr:MFS transporter [Hydrogenimonas urashimensis]
MKKAINDNIHLCDTFLFGALVLLIGSIVRVGASIYLPAMPIIGEELHIDAATMSQTLTIYFIVFASFILIAGALSDAYGRRPLLLSGMAFFIVGSTLCALAGDFETLMTGRAVQAFGASMIPGTLMATVRDTCSDLRLVSLMGWLAVLGGLFLVAAPMIGGVLTQWLGWSANFWFLVLFATLVLALTWRDIPETHAAHARTPLHLFNTLSLVGTMLTAPSFILVMLPIITFFAIQGLFLAAAPYIVMGTYGLGPVAFGLSNVIIVIGLFLGRWAGAKLLRRSGSDGVYRIGSQIAAVTALLFIALGIGLLSGIVSFFGVVALFAALFGALAPVGMKSSLTSFRANSGVAAALQGATLLGASAIGSAAFGFLLKLFPHLEAEKAFGLLSALLCTLAAWAAWKSKPV